MNKYIEGSRRRETNQTFIYKTDNLAFYYFIALLLVAILSISAYASIQNTLLKQKVDSRVINLSGRQRMLSQKLAKEMLLLVQSPSIELKSMYRDQLKKTYTLWSRVHIGLQTGDKELQLPGNNSEEVRKLFAKIEPYYQMLNSYGETILSLQLKDILQVPTDSPLVHNLVKASSSYLDLMDRIVSQFEKEAKAHVDSLKRTETYILIAVITLLFLEAMFIFRPMVKRIITTYKTLQQTNEQLQDKIKESERILKDLKESETKYRMIHATSFDGIILANEKSIITETNSRAEKIFLYDRGELIGMNLTDIIPERFRRRHQEGMNRFLISGKTRIQGRAIEVEGLRKDGSVFPIELKVNHFTIAGKIYFVASLQDITERKQVEYQLKKQAFYDSLTNLPNRASFTKRLERAIRRHKYDNNYHYAVLLMDLDRFKTINDSLGHVVGDQLLIEVAKRLESSLRPDDMVARLGGDEFAIFLNNIKDVSDASRVAVRIQEKLDEPFHIEGAEVFTAASFGIIISESNYNHVEEIFRDADIAMYRAKEHGKGCYEVFDSELHLRITKRLSLEADLRRAINNGEFLLHYQPIVSLKSGKITGVETLIRWLHPHKGLIFPGEFISIAEDTGLIIPMGEWLLKSACAQRKIWQDAGHQNIDINVNVSARQFQHYDLIDVIKTTLLDTGINAESLQLEITESVLIEPSSIEILNKISDLGIKITLDDFGTGYSSLSSLHRFPVHTVKIDRSFINEIGKTSRGESLIKAIITMAHSLNLEVVAEGIETENQLIFLMENDCDKAQGYFFSRPVDMEKLTELFNKRWDIKLLSSSKVRSVQHTYNFIG